MAATTRHQAEFGGKPRQRSGRLDPDGHISTVTTRFGRRSGACQLRSVHRQFIVKQNKTDASGPQPKRAVSG